MGRIAKHPFDDVSADREKESARRWQVESGGLVRLHGTQKVVLYLWQHADETIASCGPCEGVGGSQPAAVELLVVLVRAIQSPINVQIGPRFPCARVTVIARNDPRRNGVDKRGFTGREKQHLGTRPERGSQYDATALMAAHDGGRAYASTGGGATSKATAELVGAG